MSFTKSVYHIVFGTKYRQPTIPIDVERKLYKILYDLMKNYGAFVYRIGGMPDHVHILVDITSKAALSDFVKRLKQESSYLLKKDSSPLRRYRAKALNHTVIASVKPRRAKGSYATLSRASHGWLEVGCVSLLSGGIATLNPRLL